MSMPEFAQMLRSTAGSSGTIFQNRSRFSRKYSHTASQSVICEARVRLLASNGSFQHGGGLSSET
eukprot:8266778-Pyramimonas_sp.AAC.1